ncbi:biotin/lipoyl-containing protein [Cucumibacter marinus]|uniref:biotin/lipoyl-containing protein n=1 Tax=Cucumibacter marinus TaxID=1121252 RepID=UPI0003F723CA|nr:biotin/lipoyl-containing protein [Cucumibacter marinus]
MPHEVIMPALGMAQDTGLLVAWHKKVGDPVNAGDVLMEVETDKSTMEVEAGADGYLTELRAEAGSDVPVGDVVAVIGDTAEEARSAPEPGKTATGTDTTEPEPTQTGLSGPDDGNTVIMPALGMTQDTGLLVAWHKEPGDRVEAEDILLEVETDKSTMEVEAGHSGYVAELRAEAGESVPVGDVIAVITAEKPMNATRTNATRTARVDGTGPMPLEEQPAPAPQRKEAPARPRRVTTTPTPHGRILASPKARRLAAEQGLDLARLIAEGIEQPYHVADLETLRTLPDRGTATAAETPAAIRLTATIPTNGIETLRTWLTEETGRPVSSSAILAGLATGTLRNYASDPSAPISVAVEDPLSGRSCFVDADIAGLAGAEPGEDNGPALVLRDLTATRLTGLSLGAGPVPVVTLTRSGNETVIALEARPDALTENDAIALVTEFAARLETPLRQLL